MLSYLIVDQKAPYSQFSLQPDTCPETLLSKQIQMKILHHDAARKQVFFTTFDTSTSIDVQRSSIPIFIKSYAQEPS